MAQLERLGSQSLVFGPDEEEEGSRQPSLDQYARSDERHGTLDGIAELVRRALQCETVVIRLADGPARSGMAAASWSPIPSAGPAARDLVDPLAARDMGFRFYAGVPIKAGPEGSLGVVAAVGSQPRELDAEELGLLKTAAAIVAELAPFSPAPDRGPAGPVRAAS